MKKPNRPVTKVNDRTGDVDDPELSDWDEYADEMDKYLADLSTALDTSIEEKDEAYKRIDELEEIAQANNERAWEESAAEIQRLRDALQWIKTSGVVDDASGLSATIDAALNTEDK